MPGVLDDSTAENERNVAVYESSDAVDQYVRSRPTACTRRRSACGFAFEGYVGKRRSPLRFLERRPYYVARVPK